MPSCYVCGRTRNPSNKDLGISFHQIPKNEEYRTRWLTFIRNCGKYGMNIKPRSIICSEHFAADCFRDYNNRKFLKEHAVPSIAIDRLKSVKIKVPELKFKCIPSSDSNLEFNKTTAPTIVNCDSVQMKSVQPINDEEPSKDCTQIIIDCDPSAMFSVKRPSQKVGSIDLLSDYALINETDTPKKLILKRTISSLERVNYNQRKKIKMLNQQVRRQKQRISSLKSVVKVLKEKTLSNQKNINQIQADLIDKNFCKHKTLITNCAQKKHRT